MAHLLLASLSLWACSTGSDPDSDSGALPLDAAPAVTDAAPVTTSVPLTIADYPGGGSGRFLLVAITVNGSAPVDVLLDTGSSGLRVFASALAGTKVTTTSEATSTRLGGEVLSGHKASGTVCVGGIAIPGPLVFDLVESFSCAAAYPGCDPTSVAEYFAESGIQGIIGVGLRADPSGIHNPLARLGAPLSHGFTIRTGGIASGEGELVLGATALPDAAWITLTRAGDLPGGGPAWADDEIPVCFKVDGAPTTPPCSPSVLDTGSNLDVLYARSLPAGATTDGLLAPGVRFEAAHEQALGLRFTVGDPVTWSLDGVLVQQDEPFTILGIEVFFRHDVAFDLVNGRIGLRPLEAE
jgi:hypothetical protein